MGCITHVITTEEPEREWTINVNYRYERGYPGRGPEAWHGPEPAEPPHIEIESWEIAECYDYSFSPDQAIEIKFSHPQINATKVVEAWLAPFVEKANDDIVDACIQDWNDSNEAAMEAAYESRREY